MITSYLDYVALCTKMAEYHKQYHAGKPSPIPDEDYDALRKELIGWESEHPLQVLSFSPTFKVGYIKPESRQEQNRHEYPMASLENALDYAEANTFLKLWADKLGAALEWLVGEFKYDGMGINLTYIDTVFTRALSRGDGEYGEDITRHVSHFVRESIPEGGIVEIRGEAIIEHDWLRYMNATGSTQYANCRNAVAGLLNRKDPNEFTHGIKFMPYDIAGADLNFATHLDKLNMLKSLGFDMMSCFSLAPQAVHGLFQQIQSMRDNNQIPFDIDGVVFKINDLKQQAELGETNHSPRHSFAYKFPPVKAVCEIVGVVFQVGRTGEIAPVAKINATQLLGVTVTSVSLHNEEKMLGRKIAIGNKYEVYRSGDVIPHLGALIEAKKDAALVAFPTCCPSCNEPIVKKGAIYYCENTSACPAQQVAKIAYACSRDVLDIEGLAEQTIQMLIDTELVQTTPDIFTVRAEAVQHLEGYTEFSAQKLISAIRAARDTTMDRFIMALGITEVGKSTARKLAQCVLNKDVLFSLTTPERVMALGVEDIGPATSANIAGYFSNPKLMDIAERLYRSLNIPEVEKAIEVPGVTGKSFIFTGSFDLHRDEMEKKVVSAGGIVTTSISGKTNYCVVGEKPGSKAKKADLLGVDCIDERTFLSFFENV